MRLRHRLAIAFLTAACCGPIASAQTSAQIDAIFSSLKSSNAPGAAVLVVRNGKPVFRHGYGVTDLRTQHAIEAATNFRLASFTKQFTATCIMLLARDGKLHYDDHLTDFFPEFPAYGKSITVRNLLNHTSGLEDYGDLMMKQYGNTPPDKIPQILDAGVLKLIEQQTAGKFPPGTKWEYSNSGYAVLAMIVEKVSGEPFGQFLHERIFVPLKMRHTLAYEKGKNEVPHRAYGHSKDKGRMARDRPEPDVGGSRRWRHLFFARRPCQVGPRAPQPYSAHRSGNAACAHSGSAHRRPCENGRWLNHPLRFRVLSRSLPGPQAHVA